MKLRAMVQIEVTLTDSQWWDVQADYAQIWSDEIKAGDAPKEIGGADAWVIMLNHEDNAPGDFEIDWDGRTDEEIVDDDDE